MLKIDNEILKLEEKLEKYDLTDIENEVLEKEQSYNESVRTRNTLLNEKKSIKEKLDYWIDVKENINKIPEVEHHTDIE